MPGAGSGEAGGRHRPGRASRDARRRHRSWGQRLVVTLGCVSALALGASAAGLGYVYRKYQRLPRVELSGVLDDWCEQVGRDPAEIERSTSIRRENVDDIDALVEAGITHLIVSADGPDYDLGLLHDVLAWRNRQ